MLDLSLAGDLNVEFLGPDKGSNADFMAEMIDDSPYTIPGVSDGGAHTKFFTGGAYTTDFLTLAGARRGARSRSRRRTTACRPCPPTPPGSTTAACCARARPPTSSSTTWTSSTIDPPWIGEVAHDLPGGEWRRCLCLLLLLLW